MRSMACFNVSCTDRNAVNTDGLKQKNKIERKGMRKGESGAFTPIFKNDRSSPRISKLKWNERTFALCSPACYRRALAFLSALPRAERYFCLRDWLIDVSEKKWPLLAIPLGFACLSVRSTMLSKRNVPYSHRPVSRNLRVAVYFSTNIYRKFDFETYRICIIHENRDVLG